jgi:hypothetical protein
VARAVRNVELPQKEAPIVAKRVGLYNDHFRLLGSDDFRRVPSPAFLAPKIVEAIAAEGKSPEITTEALAERIDLPLLWTAQEGPAGHFYASLRTYFYSAN